MGQHACAWAGARQLAVFDRGDIVRVNLNPVVGHEMSDEARPVRVLTTKVFNRLGDVLVAPIAQGGDFSRYAGFVESLTGAGCTTQSAARVNKVRMVELDARDTRKIEPAPKAVIDDAIFRFLTVFESFHRI